MRVSAPRLGQLVHLLSVNPAAAFMHKTMLAALRRRRDSFDATHTVMPSPTSPHADAKFEFETGPDDRTLVDSSSRRNSSPPDNVDLISFSEDEVRLKSQNTAGDPFISSNYFPGKPALLPIVYPLPTAEDLLAHGHGQTPPPPPPTSHAASVTPLFCISRALSPPPTHYKRKRARIVPSADYDIDQDQTSIRLHIDPDPHTPLRFPF